MKFRQTGMKLHCCRYNIPYTYNNRRALSLGIYHGLKCKFTRIVFLKVVCYLMAKKWAATSRISELVDGVEP